MALKHGRGKVRPVGCVRAVTGLTLLTIFCAINLKLAPYQPNKVTQLVARNRASFRTVERRRRVPCGRKLSQAQWSGSAAER